MFIQTISLHIRWFSVLTLKILLTFIQALIFHIEPDTIKGGEYRQLFVIYPPLLSIFIAFAIANE